MERGLYYLLFGVTGVLIVALVAFWSGWRIGKKLTRMLERLYQGDLTAVKEFDLLNVQPEKLYYPFSEGELRRIAR